VLDQLNDPDLRYNSFSKLSQNMVLSLNLRFCRRISPTVSNKVISSVFHYNLPAECPQLNVDVPKRFIDLRGKSCRSNVA